MFRTIALAVLVPSLLAWGANAQTTFVERAGVREFSGELIVKPRVPDRSSAAELGDYERALAAIDRYEVVGHEPALDCFVIEVPDDESESSV